MNVFCVNRQPSVRQGDNLMFVLPDLGAGVSRAQEPHGDAHSNKDLGHREGPLNMGGRMMVEPTHAIALAAGSKAVCKVPGRIKMFIEPIQVFAQLFKSGRNNGSPRMPKIVGRPKDTAALSGVRVVLHGLKAYIFHEMFGLGVKSACVMFRYGKTHQNLSGSGGWRDMCLSAWCVVKEHRLSHASVLQTAYGGKSSVWEPISERPVCFVSNPQGVSS